VHQDTKQVLLQGTLKDGLYTFPGLKASSHYSANSLSFTGNSATINLWHQRFGHCHLKSLKKILSSCNISVKPDLHFCVACARAKCHQFPYPTSLNVYTAPLQLVYTDIWGPASVLASNGARYYVSFLDAFTKFTWIYVLHTKSQVSHAFKKFKVLVENQTGHKICNLQTDNAREVLALTPFLQQHGIHHCLTCPYTHQQNGYVERKHRHIVDMGLALLAHANLPLKFWVEAFISSVHIINVFPSPITQGDTPHHKLFHTTPNYAHFKVFGCACYPNLRPYNTCKFAFRSQCCLFLGYSLHRASYICLTADGKTIISRNVIFNETHFPYNAQTLPFAVSSGDILPTVSSTPSLTVVPFHPPPTSPPAAPPDVPLAGPPTVHSAAPALLPVSTTTNVHPMVTRAKVGTHKPKVYLSSLPDIPYIPSSVKIALASPLWSIAMQEEYNALLFNNTWTLTTLPPNASLVGCKWVFKTKLNADGSFHRCKARLVAKGFHQTHGLDYAETFSPVVRHTTIRLVLTHVVTSGWPVRQVDVNNAFLNGDLSECVYMQQPPGFVYANPHLVCRLHKAIYGLKQAPRSWFLKLSHTLHTLGFTPTKSDTSLFVRFTSSHTLLVLVYVDDILITRSSLSAITTLISSLNLLCLKRPW